jgi:uncharacterized protein (TIGR03437 family)
MKFSRRFLSILLVFAVLLAVPRAIAANHNFSPVQAKETSPNAKSANAGRANKSSLKELLKTDGTINLNSGMNGSFDASGYRMRYGTHGEPIFEQVESSDDDKWDSRFSTNGFNGSVNALAVGGNNVYVGGAFTTLGTVGMVRWDGTAFSALGSGIDTGVNSIKVRGGDVYAGGNYKLGRWDGSTWTINEIFCPIAAVEVNGNGIYLGGGFFRATGSARFIVKFEYTNGLSVLSTGVDNNVSAIASSGNALYAGGDFFTADGKSSRGIAQWNLSSWSSLGGVDGVVRAIAPSENTFYTIYVGGLFTIAGSVNANNIAKYDGNSWLALGSGVNGIVRAIAVSGNDVYIGGSFTTAGGINANNIAKYDGTSWTALGSGVNGLVRAIAIKGNDVYVGGDFTSAGGKISKNFAIYHNSIRPLASVSAASYQGSEIARDAIVSAFGTGLATTTESAKSLPLPTTLGGTTVSITDSQGNVSLAPLFYVSPTQINYLISGAVEGTATVLTSSADGTISTGKIQIVGVTPGLFSATSDGTGYAAANVQRIRGGVSTYEDVAKFDPIQNKFLPLPIDLGTDTDSVYLGFYGTGIRNRSGLANVQANIGGITLSVEYAGAHCCFVGVDQVNVKLPRSLMGRGEVDVTLTVDSKIANSVKINVK